MDPDQTARTPEPTSTLPPMHVAIPSPPLSSASCSHGSGPSSSRTSHRILRYSGLVECKVDRLK